MNEVTITQGYQAAINKAASLKEVDVEKLVQLSKLQEDWDKRHAAENYNDKMALAQGEMEPISREAVNPQTRSKYATLGKLDQAIRPIYSKHGFSIEFDEEAGNENGSLVVAYVSNGAETRKRKKWVPVVTKGIQGRDMMTLTHASMAAMTYARRTLLKMVFNISEADDDGNTAGGKSNANYRPVSETQRQHEAYANEVRPTVGEEDEAVEPEEREDWRQKSADENYSKRKNFGEKP